MVMTVVGAIRLAISFLPAPVQVIVVGTVALLVVIIVFRVIAMVLDAIPFL